VTLSRKSHFGDGYEKELLCEEASEEAEARGSEEV